MRRIDWLQVLQEHHIPFVDRGPNVKRGHINCRCPFCGTADPSHHMGLDLDTGYWGCWRNSQHRGKSPLRLLIKLLNIPFWKARQMLGLDDSYVDPEGFDAVAARIMYRNSHIQQVDQVRRDFLDFDKEFKPIKAFGSTSRFFEYLAHERDFGYEGVRLLGNLYDVCCANVGEQKDRVILPYFLNEELVAWTGRAITKASIRYKDLSLDHCLVPIKETLFNHDAVISGGRWLILQEGPMDALKVDMFGREHGVRSVALSTNTLTEHQLFQLEEAADGFEFIGVMMDMGSLLAQVDSMKMKQQLASIPNVEMLKVPFGAKDGAELTPREVTEWAQELSHTH